jgi:hypothetical protein
MISMGTASGLSALTHLLARAYRRARLAAFVCRPSRRRQLSRGTHALRTTILDLPPIASTGLADVSATTDPWTETRQAIRDLLLREDPAKFLTWRPIISTMFIDCADYASTELEELRRTPHWSDRWRPALREDDIGLPLPSKSYPLSSDNRITQAYHLLQFETTTRKRIDQFAHILEFGGGYGSLARTCIRLGFSGSYHIHDLPELAALQRYYLSIALNRSITDLHLNRPYITSSDDAALAIAMAGQGDPSKRAFIANWSFSETPLDVRDRWLAVLAQFSWFLIGYQHDFDGIDNRRWFSTLVAGRRDVAWSEWEIPHLRGNRYLIGAPRP